MKKTIVLFIAVLSVQVLCGQNKLEVGLKSKKVYFPQSIKKKNPVFKPNHLLLDDSLKIELKLIDYYQTSAEYYVFRDLKRISNIEMRRIEYGKINVYTFSKMVYSGGYGPQPGFGNTYMAGGSWRQKNYYYYEKDDQSTTLLKPKNLKNDLDGYQPALAQLTKHKTKVILSYGGLILGGAMTLGGLVKMIDDSVGQDVDPDKKPKINGLIIAGVVTMTIPMILLHKREKSLIKAVKIYNRQY
ncbi:MAG: hypothetical protein JXR03_10690 [Cyclobacteriaceae bacterium]